MGWIRLLTVPEWLHNILHGDVVSPWKHSVGRGSRVHDVDELKFYSQVEHVEGCNTTRRGNHYNGETSWCSDTMGIYNWGA